MKAIGIHIDKTKAIFFALEKDDAGNLLNITGSFKFLSLKNDTDNASVRAFKSTVYSYFEGVKPDKVAIQARQTKGRFKSAPLGFKIEGLIQCCENIEVEFVQPMTISSYYKKNTFSISLEHDYQEAAAKIAYYLLFK